uniref:Uncharacterized protein n=1 Tax=Timema cristinae TaxID=61476 RepID=A0A7R9CBD0_TIMCR|nr:unnamed protein product [Timema cristinae]
MTESGVIEGGPLNQPLCLVTQIIGRPTKRSPAVSGSIVYCEGSALDHAVNQAGMKAVHSLRVNFYPYKKCQSIERYSLDVLRSTLAIDWTADDGEVVVQALVGWSEGGLDVSVMWNVLDYVGSEYLLNVKQGKYKLATQTTRAGPRTVIATARPLCDLPTRTHTTISQPTPSRPLDCAHTEDKTVSSSTLPLVHGASPSAHPYSSAGKEITGQRAPTYHPNATEKRLVARTMRLQRARDRPLSILWFLVFGLTFLVPGSLQALLPPPPRSSHRTLGRVKRGCDMSRNVVEYIVARDNSWRIPRCRLVDMVSRSCADIKSCSRGRLSLCDWLAEVFVQTVAASVVYQCQQFQRKHKIPHYMLIAQITEHTHTHILEYKSDLAHYKVWAFPLPAARYHALLCSLLRYGAAFHFRCTRRTGTDRAGSSTRKDSRLLVRV